MLAVLSACLSPVDLTDGAGSGNNGGGENGAPSESWFGDLDTCIVPPEAGGAISQGESAVSMAGWQCGEVNVTVYAADGSVVPTTSRTEHHMRWAVFRPAAPGVFRAELEHNGEVVHQLIAVDGDVTQAPGFERVFADRLDRCFVLDVTTQGRLVCGADDRTYIYEEDGTLHKTIGAGYGGLTRVSGNEIWVAAGVGLELHTDGPDGVQLTGAFFHPGVSAGNAWSWAEPGHLFYSRLPAGLLDISWNGEDFEVSESWQTIPWYTSGPYLADEGVLLNHDLCEVSPGCVGSICKPVHSCPTSYFDEQKSLLMPAKSGRVVGFDPGLIWVIIHDSYRGHVMQLLKRPISNWEVLADRGATIPNHHFDPRQLPPVLPEGVPVYQNGGIYFLSSPRPLFVGRTHIMTLVDPFTLRFTPR